MFLANMSTLILEDELIVVVGNTKSNITESGVVGPFQPISKNDEVMIEPDGVPNVSVNCNLTCA